MPSVTREVHDIDRQLAELVRRRDCAQDVMISALIDVDSIVIPMREQHPGLLWRAWLRIRPTVDDWIGRALWAAFGKRH